MNIKNSLMIMSSHNDFPTVILRKPSTYRSIIRCSKFIGPPHKNEYDTLFRQMGENGISYFKGMYFALKMQKTYLSESVSCSVFSWHT